MSHLFEEVMEDFYMMDRVTISDGMGGFTRTWQQSNATFKAAIGKNDTLQARVAEQEGMKQIYTVTTNEVVLEFHDVIKRKKDGKIFRITGEQLDNSTPMMASFRMAQVSAEEWELTT